MIGGRKIKIGIVGCGTIGHQLAWALEKRFSEQAELFAVCDIDQAQAKRLQASSSFHPQILPLDELIDCCDLIIEAAAALAASEVAQKTLVKGKDVMIMSVAGVLTVAQQLFALAKDRGGHIYLPSGALGGLDAVKAAAMAKIRKVTLITRKPPQALKGAPFLKEKKIDIAKIKKETVVFAGSASEAVKGFPQNVNVCATLSLAGIGPEKTQVKVVTSPEYKANIHEIEVEGDFGKLVARTENLPSPENPKTSLLASLSAIATLKGILNAVKIGT